MSIPLTNHQALALLTCSGRREDGGQGKEGQEKGKGNEKRDSGAPLFQDRHADSPNKLIKGMFFGISACSITSKLIKVHHIKVCK